MNKKKSSTIFPGKLSFIRIVTSLTLLTAYLPNASAIMVDFEPINGLGTFQDTNGGRVWLDLNVFGPSLTHDQKAAAAVDAGFTLASLAEIRLLTDGSFDSQTYQEMAAVAGDYDHHLMGGVFLDSGLYFQHYVYDGTGGWGTSNSGQAGSVPTVFMGIWAYTDSYIDSIRDPMWLTIADIDRQDSELNNTYVVSGDDPGIRSYGVSFISPDDFEANGVPWTGRMMHFDDPDTWVQGVVPIDGDRIEWRGSFLTPYVGDTLIYRDPTAGADTPKFTGFDINNFSASIPQLFGGPLTVDHSQDKLRAEHLRLLGKESTDLGAYTDRHLYYNMYQGTNIPEIEADNFHITGTRFNLQEGIVRGADFIGIGYDSRFVQSGGEVSTNKFDITSANYTLNAGTLTIGGAALGQGSHDGDIRGDLYLNGGELISLGADEGGYWGSTNIEGGAVHISGNASVNSSPADGDLRNISGVVISQKRAQNEAAVYDSTSSHVNFRKVILDGDPEAGRSLYDKNGSGFLTTTQIIIGRSPPGAPAIGLFRQSHGEVYVKAELTNEGGYDPGHGGILEIRSGSEYALSGGELAANFIEINNGGLFNMTGGTLSLLGKFRGDLLNQGTFLMTGGSTEPFLTTSVSNEDDGLFHVRGDGQFSASDFYNGGGFVRIVGDGEVRLSQTYTQKNSTVYDRETNEWVEDYSSLTIVNGLLAATTIDILDGTLGGSGSIYGDVNIGDGAELLPGNSPGTLFIDGDLLVNVGASIVLEITDSEVDRLVVTGTITILGDIVFELPDDLGLGFLENLSLADFFFDGPSVAGATAITDFGGFSGASFFATTGNELYSYDVNASGRLVNRQFVSSVSASALATPVPTMTAYGLVLTGLALVLIAARRLRGFSKPE